MYLTVVSLSLLQNRLNMQINATGVLFLILPKRCLDNSNMQGVDQFVKLLAVFGLQLLEEPHFTPRLAFFVLQRNHPVYKKVFKTAVQGEFLGTNQDKNDPDTSEWGKVIRQFVIASQDTETKDFFSNDKLNVDEFCVRISPSWSTKTK
jgi:hypothetical protein